MMATLANDLTMTTCPCGEVVPDTEESWRAHNAVCGLPCGMCGEVWAACVCPTWCEVCGEPFRFDEFEQHRAEHEECIDCGYRHDDDLTCGDVAELVWNERMAGWIA